MRFRRIRHSFGRLEGRIRDSLRRLLLQAPALPFSSSRFSGLNRHRRAPEVAMDCCFITDARTPVLCLKCSGSGVIAPHAVRERRPRRS